MIYVAHSNNSEILDLCTEFNINLEKEKLFNEAIKCHHNSFANFIKDNFFTSTKDDENLSSSNSTKEYEDLSSSNSTEEYEDLSSSNSTKEDEDFHHSDDGNEVTAFHAAIEKGNVSIVKLLLSIKELNISAKRKLYIKKEDWSDNELFQFHNYDYFESLVEEKSPLHIAVENCQSSIIKLLLSNPKIDVNLLDETKDDETRSELECYTKSSPIHTAAEKGDVEIIKILLDNDKIDPNIIKKVFLGDFEGNGMHMNSSETTPFHIAINNNKIDAVKAFLECDKVNFNQIQVKYKYYDEHEDHSLSVTKTESPPLHLAIYQNNVEMVKLLLSSEKINYFIFQKTLNSNAFFDDWREWDKLRAFDGSYFDDCYQWKNYSGYELKKLEESNDTASPLELATQKDFKEIVKQINDFYGSKELGNDHSYEIDDNKVSLVIEFNKNKAYSIETNKNDTIENVLKFLKSKDVVSDKIILTYAGVKLDKSKTINDYLLSNGSKLYALYIKDECPIIFVHFNENDYIPFAADLSNNINWLKYNIYYKYNIQKNEQKLLFNGIELEDDKNLQNYSIEDGSILNLELENSNEEFHIKVKLLNDQELIIEVHSNDLIENIKAKIQELNGINQDNQVLVLDGEQLDDNKKISDYFIHSNSNLLLLQSTDK